MVGHTTLIDNFLPNFDVRSTHGVLVQAPPPVVIAAIHRLDLSKARIARWLFRVRGMPTYAMTLEGAQRMGFILLGERPNQELVLGLVGRFWTLKGHLQRLDAEGYRQFHQPGFAKAAWNFSLTPAVHAGSTLRTETRVLCLDGKSSRAFRRYWLVVRPFSGWIRQIALRLIKADAEAAWRKP